MYLKQSMIWKMNKVELYWLSSLKRTAPYKGGMRLGSPLFIYAGLA